MPNSKKSTKSKTRSARKSATSRTLTLIQGQGVQPAGTPTKPKRVHSPNSGTRVIDRTVQKTNIWLKDVMRELSWSSRERSYSVLRATLHALRDILILEEAVQLSAQLPTLLRGVYFEGWSPHRTPVRLKNMGEFFDLVRFQLGAGGAARYSREEAAIFTRACMKVLMKHVSAGEMSDVKGNLPRKLRPLVTLFEGETSFTELSAAGF